MADNKRTWTVGVRDEDPEVLEESVSGSNTIEDKLNEMKKKPKEEQVDDTVIEPEKDSEHETDSESESESEPKEDPTSNGYNPDRHITTERDATDHSSEHYRDRSRDYNQDGVDNGYQGPNSGRRPGPEEQQAGAPGAAPVGVGGANAPGGAGGAETAEVGGGPGEAGGRPDVGSGPRSDPYDENLGQPGERATEGIPEGAEGPGANNGLPNQPNQGLGEEGGGPGGLDKKDDLGENPNSGLGNNQGPGRDQGPGEAGPEAVDNGRRGSDTQGGPGGNGYGATRNMQQGRNDPTANARRNLDHQNRANGPVSSNGAADNGGSRPRSLNPLSNTFNNIKQKLNPFSRLGLNRGGDGGSGGKLDGGGNTESTEAEHGKVSLGKKALSFLISHPYIAGIAILLLILVLLIIDTAVIEPSSGSGRAKYGNIDYGNYELNSDDDEILHEPLEQFLQSKGTSLEAFNQKISSNVDKNGFGTRAGVVAAAVTLIAELGNNYDVKVPYFWGGGHGDGIADGAKARWGSTDCHTYANGQDYNYCGLDCSGFVPWAINNGGFNVSVNLASNFQNLPGVRRVTLSSSQPVIQPGDLLESEHHVVLVVGIDEENHQYICAEASGNARGVLFTRRSYADSGYWGVDMEGYYSTHAKTK